MDTTLLIVDPHLAARRGLASFLVDTEVRVVGEATSVSEMFEQIERSRPDVVLLGTWAPGHDGMDGLSEVMLRYPGLRVVMLACEAYPAQMAQAYRTGASGYLIRSVTRDDFVEAIRRVVSEGKLWAREDLRRITGVLTAPQPKADGEVPLTPRELDVLRRVAEGKTNRVIAEDFDISYETVKEHVQHILRKTGLQDRTQAAVWAVRAGLL